MNQQGSLLGLISYVEEADILSNILTMRLEQIKVILPPMENAEIKIKQTKSDVIIRNRKTVTFLSSIRNL